MLGILDNKVHGPGHKSYDSNEKSEHRVIEHDRSINYLVESQPVTVRVRSFLIAIRNLTA